MSVKLEIYQAIKVKLLAIDGMRNVEHYNGQDIYNYEKDHARRFPQCWIRFQTIQWQPSMINAYNQNATREQKSALFAVTVHFATFNLKSDNDTFESDLENIDTIYRALTNLEGDNFTSLQRISEEDSSNNDNVRVWPITFTTMATECGISKEEEDAAPLALIINKEYI